MDVLRSQLERLYRKYNQKKFLHTDPLGVLDRTGPFEDLEVLSYVLAGLSYGRVEQIRKDYLDLIFRLQIFGVKENGKNFSTFLKTLTNPIQVAELNKGLKGWKHRLNTAEDMVLLFVRLGVVLNQYGSLAGLAQDSYSKNKLELWQTFLLKLRGGVVPPKIQQKRWQGTGVSWFAPDLSAGGTSKRFFMWLRWLLRNDEIDLGLWSQNSKLFNAKKPKPSVSQIYVPLDTHVAKWCRDHGVFAGKSLTFKQTLIATEFFEGLNPKDPLKYDFAICQDGVQRFRGSL